MLDRKKYFGSSDAKDLVSLEPYGCRRAMVMRKAGVAEDDARPGSTVVVDEEEITPQMLRGILLEPLIINRVSLDLGVDVTPLSESLTEGSINEGMEWLRATPDGVVDISGDEGAQESLLSLLPRGTVLPACVTSEPGLVEAKSVAQAPFWTVKKDGAVRQDHLIQVYHQLAATDKSWAVVVYLHPDSWSWIWFIVLRDKEWERENYIPMVQEAWSQIARAKAGINPARSPDEWEPFLPSRLDGNAKACKTCRRRRTCWGSLYSRVLAEPGEGDPLDLEGDEEWRVAAKRLVDAKATLKAAEAEKDSATNAIKTIMGEDAIAAKGMGYLVRHKPQSSKRHDSALFKKEQPALAAKYSKPSESRPLNIYEVS